MNKDQFELLALTQSAFLEAGACGYEATAAALGEMFALLMQDFGGVGEVRSTSDTIATLSPKRTRRNYFGLYHSADSLLRLH